MKSVIFLGSLISGLIILLPSCKKQVVKIEGGIQVSINTDKIDTFYKASDIFESVRIVPLETIDESLLGNISKVVIANNIIYVLDNHIKTIVLFDLDGKFIKKINRRGRGSKEYIDLEDFVVLPNRNMVLLDGESQKLIFLDESGEPFDEQKLPFFCDAFEQLTESVLVFNGAGYNDRIIVWDVSEKKIITSFLKYDVKYSTKPLKPLIKYDNMVYYFHDYLSHLYDVTPESISVCWNFDFGSRTIKESDLQMGMFGAYFKKPSVVDLSSFTETSSYAMLKFDCDELNGLPYYTYYSKNTTKMKILNVDSYEDDMTFNIYPPDVVTATNEGEFIAVLSPYYLLKNNKEYLTELKDKTRSDWEKYNSQIRGVSEGDNPVIGFYKLKDF